MGKDRKLPEGAIGPAKTTEETFRAQQEAASANDTALAKFARDNPPKPLDDIGYRMTMPAVEPPSGPAGARSYALAAAKLCEGNGAIMDSTRLNAVRMLKAAVALLEG